MRVGGSHLHSMQWSMTRRRLGLRITAHGIAAFLTGMHPDLSLRDYPYLVTSHARPRYRTANRTIACPQRGCSGHPQDAVDCRSMCRITMDEHNPLRKAQTSTVTPVPGFRVTNAQHLLRLHNSELAVPSVTQRNANPSACRTEQYCQHRSTTFVDRLSEPCASAQELNSC